MSFASIDLNGPSEYYTELYMGYPLCVKGIPIGYRCGYIGLPINHPFYGLNYNEIEEVLGGSIEVHGGLSFSGYEVVGGAEDVHWWLGFDCAHFDDRKDRELMTDHFLHLHELMVDEGIDDESGTLWTQKMVIQECRNLIEQMEMFKDMYYSKDHELNKDEWDKYIKGFRDQEDEI